MLFSKSRIITHIWLALITLLGCYLTTFYKNADTFAHALAIGFGYVSLFLLVITLLIGPMNLLSQKNRSRNPVNIYFRRDIGIWAGFTGCLHVWFGLQVHLGGQPLLYFLEKKGNSYVPASGLFGLSNYIGAFATLILLILLLLSNDITLKRLKGKVWKLLQRTNYVLFLLVLAHTLAYQVVVKREQIFMFAVMSLTVVLLLVQALGLYLSVSRRKVKSTD